MRKVTTASKSFWYLSGSVLTVATPVDNLSHLMSFNRYGTFDPELRPWCSYSIRFPRIIWYLTWRATYFSQFHAFFCPSCIDVCNNNLLLMQVCSHGSGLAISSGWHKVSLCHPSWTYAAWHMDTYDLVDLIQDVIDTFVYLALCFLTDWAVFSLCSLFLSRNRCNILEIILSSGVAYLE